MTLRSHRIVALAAVAGLASACVRPGVQRAARGEVFEGRAIAASAYASYAAGAIDEATGNLAEAERRFREAIASDDAGPEPRTRLGAVLCSKGSIAAGLDAIDEALAIDPASASAWLERARCSLREPAPARALNEAERALGIDPRSVEASLVQAEALVALDRRVAAVSSLVARVLAGPSDPRVLERLAQLDDGSRPDLAPFVRSRSERQSGLPDDLVTDTRRPSTRAAQRTEPSPGALDRALEEGDRAAARVLARRLGLDVTALALRALASGHAELALAEIDLALAADPSRLDAFAARIVALAALGQLEALARGPFPASEAHAIDSASLTMARRELASVLTRWVGASELEASALPHADFAKPLAK